VTSGEIKPRRPMVKEHTYTHTHTHESILLSMRDSSLNPTLNVREAILSLSQADSILCGFPEKLDYSINDKTVKLL